MASHSSVIAWRIPESGEPGGLLSMGSHRVGHDWSDLAAAAAAFVIPKYFWSGHLFLPLWGWLGFFFAHCITGNWNNNKWTSHTYTHYFWSQVFKLPSSMFRESLFSIVYSNMEVMNLSWCLVCLWGFISKEYLMWIWGWHDVNFPPCSCFTWVLWDLGYQLSSSVKTFLLWPVFQEFFSWRFACRANESREEEICIWVLP